MKIDKHLLKFPQTLPNDLESFMLFYPEKFPAIVDYYEEIAPKIAGDPKAYEKYGFWARDELFEGFEKIKNDYEKGDQDDLAFLVEIDQRFHKLTCYRFWIVNYLFPDGPIHEFYVNSLKDLIHKFVDVGEEVEEYEDKVVKIQRDMLQSDYADLYLQQALGGVNFVKLLEENKKTKLLLNEAIDLIDQHSSKNTQKINSIWDRLLEVISKDTSKNATTLKEVLAIPFAQAKMRGSQHPVYNMLTHAVEFREENKMLAERHDSMKQQINILLRQAKEKLDADDYTLFEVAYQQSRNFAMFKDIMGDIDRFLLPLWFGLHDKVKKILLKTTSIKPVPTGHSAMFKLLVWYLPPDLKTKVMTPDLAPFDLKTL